MLHQITLGIDPGYINTGYAVREFRAPDAESPLTSRLLATGILGAPIQNFKFIAQSIQQFEAEIESMLRQHMCTGLGIERFVGRQFTPKGKNPESISFMVAVAASVGARLRMPTTLITAAQWKNAFSKMPAGVPLADMYRNCRAPAHLVDACLQAQYVAEKSMGRTPYSTMTRTGCEQLLRRIEARADPATLRKIRASGTL